MNVMFRLIEPEGDTRKEEKEGEKGKEDKDALLGECAEERYVYMRAHSLDTHIAYDTISPSQGKALMHRHQPRH